MVHKGDSKANYTYFLIENKEKEAKFEFNLELS